MGASVDDARALTRTKSMTPACAIGVRIDDPAVRPRVEVGEPVPPRPGDVRRPEIAQPLSLGHPSSGGAETTAAIRRSERNTGENTVAPRIGAESSSLAPDRRVADHDRRARRPGESAACRPRGIDDSGPRDTTSTPPSCVTATRTSSPVPSMTKAVPMPGRTATCLIMPRSIDLARARARSQPTPSSSPDTARPAPTDTSCPPATAQTPRSRTEPWRLARSRRQARDTPAVHTRTSRPAHRRPPP